MKQTTDPATITGILPMRSASLPLNGRDNIAVTVKSEMIKPLYSPPPIDVRYEGSSGTIMLKLPKNKKELRHISQKGLE